MKRARKLTAIIMAAVLMLSMMTVNVFAAVDPDAVAAVEGATFATNPADVEAVIAHLNSLMTGAFSDATVADAPANGVVIVPATTVAAGSVRGNVVITQTTYNATVTLDITIPRLTSVVVDGQGRPVFVDTTVFDFVLPTSASFNFVLDPLGIVNATPNASTGVVEPDPDFVGRILPASPGAQVLNLSSVDMNLTVSYIASATGAEIFPSTATPDRALVTRGIAYVDGAANRLSTEAATIPATSVNYVGASPENWGTIPNRAMLYIVPRRTATGITAIATDPDWRWAPAVAAEQRAFVFDTTARNMTFRLPAASYQIVYDDGRFVYRLENANQGHGTEFQVGGFVNRFADWSTGSVNAAVTFAFTTAPVLPPAGSVIADNVAFLQAPGGTVGDPTGIPANLILAATDATALVTTDRQVRLGAPAPTVGFVVGGNVLTTATLSRANPHLLGTGGFVGIQMTSDIDIEYIQWTTAGPRERIPLAWIALDPLTDQLWVNHTLAGYILITLSDDTVLRLNLEMS